MSFFKKLFGKKKPKSDGMDEHLVRVHIPILSDMPTTEEFDRYVELEDLLGDAAIAAGVGDLDGNEVGGGEYTIWLYGKSAGPLAEVVKAELAKHSLPAGSFIFVRHGGVGDETAKEERIPIA